MAKKLVAEFLGTFCLVFAGTGAIVIDTVSGGAVSHVGVALTFGLIVLAMIYAIGDISRAHINPAATIGFFPVRVLQHDNPRLHHQATQGSSETFGVH
jgi:aquaporin NIP